MLDNAQQSQQEPSPDKTGQLVSLESIKPSIINYFQNKGLIRGLTTGWHVLDDLWMLQKGQLTIVTGIPSSGKSEILDQLILNTIALHDWHWTVFSPENWPLEHHFQKLSEKWTGKPMFPLFHMQDTISQEDIDQTIVDIEQFITFVDPPKENMTIKPILELVKKSCTEHSTDAFLLDPWNELEHHRPKTMSETEYIGAVLSILRNFGRRNNIAMFVVAHPTKLIKDDSGNYPVPTPYDISGSSNWRNKADVCISIWRDYVLNDGLVQVHVQKVRNKNLGTLGCRDLHWNRANGIFFNEKEPKYDYERNGIKERVRLR